jgi:hypothetical protein
MAGNWPNSNTNRSWKFWAYDQGKAKFTVQEKYFIYSFGKGWKFDGEAMESLEKWSWSRKLTSPVCRRNLLD